MCIQGPIDFTVTTQMIEERHKAKRLVSLEAQVHTEVQMHW